MSEETTYWRMEAEKAAAKGQTICQANRQVSEDGGESAVVLCYRSAGHDSLHFDQPNLLWWAGHDNRGVGSDGRTLRGSTDSPSSAPQA